MPHRNSHVLAQMTVSLLNDILQHAGQPGEFPPAVLHEFIQLTGARCGALVQCLHGFGGAGHRVAAVLPERRSELSDRPELIALTEHVHKRAEISEWYADDPGPWGKPLAALGCNMVLAIPLNMGDLRLGALLLFDLPELDRVRDVTQVFRSVATVIAAVFRTALLYEHQESLVATRTREVREHAARLQAVFDNRIVGIVIVDSDGRFQSVNDRWCDMIGYSREELLAGVRFTDITHSDDLDRNLALRNRMAAGEVQAYRIEKRYVRKDGTEFWGDLSVSPIRDENGRMTAQVGIVVDITDRKSLEEQLLQSQKMEAIGQLAGGIAHDFNNILTAINGYAEMVLARLPEDSPVRRMVSDIFRSGQRAADLTRQLLAFSRKQPRQLKLVALNPEISAMENMLRRVIGEDIRLVLDLSEETGTVQADPVQLHQVILNLVVNGADALRGCPEIGKPEIRIQTGTRQVNEDDVITRLDLFPGRYAVISVMDNGPGIPKEIQDRIFDPFFTTKGVGKGTGLGLSTVYGIARQNGGAVSVYSETGMGATFRVYWPLSKADSETTESSELAHTPPQTGSGDILVVEDDELVREMAVEVLGNAGYTVTAAASGEEALRLVASGAVRPRLVFSDVIMTGITGLQLAKQLRAHLPGVEILLSSGYTPDRAGYGDGGMGFHFLGKPYSTVELTEAVHRILTVEDRNDLAPE